MPGQRAGRGEVRGAAAPLMSHIMRVDGAHVFMGHVRRCGEPQTCSARAHSRSPFSLIGRLASLCAHSALSSDHRRRNFYSPPSRRTTFTFSVAVAIARTSRTAAGASFVPSKSRTPAPCPALHACFQRASCSPLSLTESPPVGLSLQVLAFLKALTQKGNQARVRQVHGGHPERVTTDSADATSR